MSADPQEEFNVRTNETMADVANALQEATRAISNLLATSDALAQRVLKLEDDLENAVDRLSNLELEAFAGGKH